MSEARNRTKQESGPMLFNTDYQIQILFDLLDNKRYAAPDLFEKMLNVNREEGEPYKILTPEQNNGWDKIYTRRRQNQNYNQYLQGNILKLGAIVAVGHGLKALFEALD